MDFSGFQHGMGIGGWLTNYKRFNVLPMEWRLPLTIGDFEHFDTYITEWDIQNIAGMGMDHIRLGFDQIVIEEAPGKLRERTMGRIDAFITWCERAGINMVLNLHKAVGNYCDIKEDVTLLENKELQDRFIALWVSFEKRYAGQNNLLFELLNEVRGETPEGCAQWNSLAQRTVDAIHAVNPNRILVVGGTLWNSPYGLAGLGDFGENVVYTWHNYEPCEFTHQRGVLQSGQLYYNRDMPYPTDDMERYRDYQRTVWKKENPYPGFDRVDRKFLAHFLQPAFDFAEKRPGKIVWCGEFGTIRHAKLEWRENYMRDMISLLKEHHTPWCVWNYLSTPNDGNRFSLVDDDTRKILSPELGRIIRGDF